MKFPGTAAHVTINEPFCGVIVKRVAGEACELKLPITLLELVQNASVIRLLVNPPVTVTDPDFIRIGDVETTTPPVDAPISPIV